MKSGPLFVYHRDDCGRRGDAAGAAPLASERKLAMYELDDFGRELERPLSLG